ncbi:molybdenum cofactor biosynthesis protein MoaE [Pontixanthobacter sp.]|uniref:molybdenum cofactor biosynthesis protein MoaE n=1 Tax=Pontixanthobacter sp. TaxID=2792078 RepID=UPI003C7D9BB9
MMRDLRLIAKPFAYDALVSAFARSNTGFGGMCTFVGEVRRDEDVQALELTHYEPLTLPGMHQIADAAEQRFAVLGILMAHRFGTLYPGEPIVCVSAAALHRRAAIDAVDFCMDHLKSAAWFWKRELRGDGWHWIEPRSDDYTALQKWK